MAGEVMTMAGIEVATTGSCYYVIRLNLGNILHSRGHAKREVSTKGSWLHIVVQL
jgi:hypothetical protein